MSTIIVEKECGCFRRSEHQNNVAYPTKEEALMKALDMVADMNTTFCKKHRFAAVEDGENIIIKMDMN